MTSHERTPAARMGTIGPARPVMLTLPEGVMGEILEVLHPLGLDVDVLDDGEDGGAITAIAVLSSATMTPHVKMAGISYHAAYLQFLFAAFLVVIAAIMKDWVLGSLATFFMAFGAGNIITRHRRRGRLQHIQSVIAKAGH